VAFGAPSLKGRALRLLAQREQSRAELERKLARQLRDEARRRAAVVALATSAGQLASAAPAEPNEPNEPAEPAAPAAPVDGVAAAERIARVLDELAAVGLLSDERAAESVLAARRGRLGPRRLERELQQRGIDPALAGDALRSARDSEHRDAQALWQRRFGAAPADAREHARQVRFLLGRGFSAEVVQRVVSRAGEDALPPDDAPD
jgi:regulatory protein